MQFFVTKTGLDAFDVARAWGLTVLLNVLTEDEVRIRDLGLAFVLEPSGNIPQNAQLTSSSWRTLFVAEDVQWEGVFLTQRRQREALKQKVQQALEQKWQSLLNELKRPDSLVQIGRGKNNLPGGLEPAAFKGLRHTTKASYTEEQLSVPEEHWALSCLGMATCGTYRFSREAGQSNWLVLLPIPEDVRFNYFRDVQELMRPSRLHHRGAQNAAAHYAVQLAERLRERAAAQGSLQDRFSAILYFMLFGAGQQLKPSQGSQLNLAPLMEAIQRDPHETEAVLKWLDYCFRLGAVKGAEDLTLAATELVMRWDLDAFEKLVKVLVRILGKEQLRRKSPRDFREILWRTDHQSLQETMEVMQNAQTV